MKSSVLYKTYSLLWNPYHQIIFCKYKYICGLLNSITNLQLPTFDYSLYMVCSHTCFKFFYFSLLCRIFRELNTNYNLVVSYSIYKYIITETDIVTEISHYFEIRTFFYIISMCILYCWINPFGYIYFRMFSFSNKRICLYPYITSFLCLQLYLNSKYSASIYRKTL